MFKTCERCKALEINGSVDGKCSLGYVTQEYRPVEECPKPLTNLQLMECVPITKRRKSDEIHGE